MDTEVFLLNGNIMAKREYCWLPAFSHAPTIFQICLQVGKNAVYCYKQGLPQSSQLGRFHTSSEAFGIPRVMGPIICSKLLHVTEISSNGDLLKTLVTTRPIPYIHETSSVLRRSPLELLSVLLE